MDNKLQTLESLLAVVDTKATMDEFMQAFEAVLGVFTTLKADTEADRTFIKAEAIKVIGELQNGIARVNALEGKLKNIKDGETPTNEKLLALIQPLIPYVEDGKSPTDEHLLSLIRPLIPIVKDGVTPVKGIDYLDGNDGSPDSPDQIVEKVNTSSLVIKKERVEGLVDALMNIAHGVLTTSVGITTAFYNGLRAKNLTIAAGSNTTVTQTQQGDLVTVTISSTGGGSGSGFQAPTSGVVDGSNTVFVWATTPNSITVDQGRAMQKVSSDTTVNWTGTTTTTLTVAPNFDIFSTA